MEFWKKLTVMIAILLLGCEVQAQVISSDSILAAHQQAQLDSLKKVVAKQSYQLNQLVLKSYNDSLMLVTRKSQDDLLIFKRQLERYYKQNKTANIITASGVAGVVLGTFIAIQSPPGGSAGPSATMFFLGSIAASVVAPIIRLDANKHLRFLGKTGSRR